VDGLTTFFDVLTAVVSVGVLTVAYFSYRFTHDTKIRETDIVQARKTAEDAAAEAIQPLVLRLAALEVSLKELHDFADRAGTQGSTGLGALAGRVAVLEAGEKTDIRELHEALARVDSQGSAGLGVVAVRVSVLESKMEVFWRNVAYDVSKILHSPHSGWESLDALLEKFRANAINHDEMTELEELLRSIVDGRWTAGNISRGDQVAASLMLHAIEQTRV
jgi:hypothetical protein